MRPWRRNLTVFALVGWVLCAWYLFYPHAVTVRELSQHPDRYAGRMVRIEGLVGSDGDSTYLSIMQPAFITPEMPVNATFGDRFLAWPGTSKTFRELHQSARLLRAERRKGIARYRETPGVVAGWFSYSDKACFSSGLNVRVVYASLSDNPLTHSLRFR